jgi:hypothetical protein
MVNALGIDGPPMGGDVPVDVDRGQATPAPEPVPAHHQVCSRCFVLLVQLVGANKCRQEIVLSEVLAARHPAFVVEARYHKEGRFRSSDVSPWPAPGPARSVV